MDALQHCRQALLTKLEKAKRDLEAVERAMQLLRGCDADTEASEDDVRTYAKHVGEMYTQLPPQKAIRRFFMDNPGQSFKPSVLARKLRSLGYAPTTSNRNIFVTQVRTACVRLKTKGFLEQTELNGRIAFRLAADAAAAT